MASYLHRATGSLFFHGLKHAFVHEASGGFCCVGRATTDVEKFIKTKYKPGDVVYNKMKAAKGILEAVAIKRIEIVENGSLTYGLYVDTLNSHWNDKLLVEQNEAVALAQAYYAKILAWTHQQEIADPPASCRS